MRILGGSFSPQAPYEERFEVPAGVRVVGAAAFAKGCPAAARHRCARLAGARGRLGGRPRRFGGPAIRAALARIVARCGGRVTDFQAVEENQCWYGLAAGNDPAEKDVVAGEGGVAKEVGTAREVGAAAGGGIARRPIWWRVRRPPTRPRASSPRRLMPA